MIKKDFSGRGYIGKGRIFRVRVLALILISIIIVPSFSNLTVSSSEETTNLSQQTDILAFIQEYLSQGGEEAEFIIQQSNVEFMDSARNLANEEIETSSSKAVEPIGGLITPKATPTQVSPSNGATITDRTPYIDWTGGGEYMDFCLQIDDNSDFTSPVVDVFTGFNTYYTVTTSLASDTYYWRVREQDYFSHTWGAWSGTWSFTVDLTPTVAPTLLSPDDEEFINDDTPVLDWTDVPLATGYRVQIATSTLFLLPEVDGTVTGSAATSPHLNDRHWYWRVRGYNSDGDGPWSEKWGFTVDTVPPDTVTLSTPQHGSISSDYTPTYSWLASSGAYRYQLQIAYTSDFSSLLRVVTTESTSYTASATLNGLYYWRVKAIDQAGNESPWSAIRYHVVDKPVPPAPILVSPPSGTWINDNTPYLGWNPASLAVSYQVQLSTTPSFTTTERDIQTSGLYYIPSTLPDGTYYWRVRGRDDIGNWGPWSTVWQVNIDTVPPGTPTPTNPGSFTYTNDNTPSFYWTTASGAYSYQIQISRDLFFSLIFLESTSTNTYYTPVTVFTDGDYWWRVRAIDRAGNAGTWSTIWLISVDTVPPGTATPTTPTDDSQINDNTPFLEWDPATGGYQYEIQISTDAGFSIVVTDLIIGNTNYTTSILSDDVYYWRIRAIDQAGNIGGWSEVFQFTVDTVGPDQVPLYLPGNSVALNDSTPQLQWYILSDAVEYQILVDTDDLFASPLITEITSKTFLDLSVLADGDYYWMVRARDEAGNWGSWSTIWSFTIDTTAPDQPTLNSPANATSTSDNTPQLLVLMVASATSYQFQVSTTDTFGTLIIDVEVASNAYTLIAVLADGTYYWRVRAADTLDNWSEWSEIWIFTVDTTGPTAPTLTDPIEDNITNDNSIYLEWNTVIDGVLYQVQVDNVWDFSSVAVDYTSGATSYLTPVLEDGMYYWRVRTADDLSNWSNWSEVRTFTIDTTNPEINHPEDINYDYGSAENNITWIVSDINLAEMIIYLDGEEYLTLDLTGMSGIEYTLDVDGLDIGVYNFTIYVTDLVLNSVSDTVFVTVNVVVPEFNPIMGFLLIGLCVIIPLISLKQKFKYKK